MSTTCHTLTPLSAVRPIVLWIGCDVCVLWCDSFCFLFFDVVLHRRVVADGSCSLRRHIHRRIRPPVLGNVLSSSRIISNQSSVSQHRCTISGDAGGTSQLAKSFALCPMTLLSKVQISWPLYLRRNAGSFLGTWVRNSAKDTGGSKRVSEPRRFLAITATFALSTVAHLIVGW